MKDDMEVYYGPNFVQNESSECSQLLPLTRETETN